jgi:hypothetical protein
MEARGGNGRDSIETPFKNLIGDSQPLDDTFSATGIVIMLRCDNLACSRG